jgi:hypothetical protein
MGLGQIGLPDLGRRKAQAKLQRSSTEIAAAAHYNGLYSTVI